MSARIDSLLAGLGSVPAVTDAILCDLGKDGPESDKAVDFCNAAREMLQHPALANAFYAIVAAILNESMMETGRLFSAKPGGGLTHDYISGDSDKKRMASLLAGI